MKTVRCAIYTRKSSDEGLDQGFNSLDAQREACAAYILSQASEGWVALPDIYDDGGISGGTLERPALQRLLTEVAAGRIDIIVVYKVDRLTRSLIDFSKLVEAFDKAGTSFVSITQLFNTTTSMGRLTLNMLLSFAQFEREVTAERIRDKIAASKAKGMWMGGIPPLGYEADGRSLKIVEKHAALVREIFESYLALRSVRSVADELQQRGVTAPLRQTLAGRAFGGSPLSRGQIYKLLHNTIYIGVIRHNGQQYPALHQPIIRRQVWDEVQSMLAQNLQGSRSSMYARARSPLAGRVFDAAGDPLVSVHANKGGKNGAPPVRYRYYVSQALQEGRGKDGWRVPARELEGVVAERVAEALDDPLGLVGEAALPCHVSELANIDQRCRELAAGLRGRSGTVQIEQLVERVRVESGRVLVVCLATTICEVLGLPTHRGTPDVIELVSEVRLTRSGRAMRLINTEGRTACAEPNQSLIRLVLQAQAWWAELRKGQLNISELAIREGVQDAWISRVVRLAFLSPAIVEAIIRGDQPVGLSSSRMVTGFQLPPDWQYQQRLLMCCSARP